MDNTIDDPNLLIPDEEDDDDSVEFNCEPVVRNFVEEEIRYSPAPERARMPSETREAGIRLNNRIRRKATLHAHINGLASSYLDQDTSGTYDPKSERASPSLSPPLRTRKPRAPGGNSRPRSRTIGEPKELIIRIKLTTPKSLKYLRSITPDVVDVVPTDNDSGYRSVKKRKTRQPTGRAYTNLREDSCYCYP